VKPLVSLILLLLTASGVAAWPSFSADDPAGKSPFAATPHPAVVRVMVPDGRLTSFGSGALVAVTEHLGLVVTNWHVVQDTRGEINVVFPDGFRSPATLLNTDRDWDLAALAIWRPRVAPIPLAGEPPRPGDPLTIAGYGKGRYRAVTGRCTQYVAPGYNKPFEIVELSAGARQGDSGGPIFNAKGELAGVLFGAALGRTAGSYCGRVRWFLASISDDFQHLDATSTMIAQQPSPEPAPNAGQPWPETTPNRERPQPRIDPIVISELPSPSQETGGDPHGRETSRGLPVAAIPIASSPPDGSSGSASAGAPSVGQPAGPETALALRWEDIAGTTRGEQAKTILAAVGALAIFLHALRLTNRARAS
jgi:hypothetical protein